MSRVGHGAHDVKQELLALAIEISELRHFSPFASQCCAPGRRPGLADTLAPSRDRTQGNRQAPDRAIGSPAGPGAARPYNTGL
jgi:hypothetical protein